MRRTSPLLLVLLVVLAAGFGWLVQVLLVGAGSGTFVPPVTLVVGLLAVAALVLAFGWPVRQTVRGKRIRPVDPFLATRVLALAKACAMVGALLTGGGGGLLLFDLTRPVVPMGSVLALVAGAVVASLAVLGVGIVVEGWCRIPPRDDSPVEPLRGLERH